MARVKQLLGINSNSAPEKQPRENTSGFFDFQRLAKSANKDEAQTGPGKEMTSGSESKSPQIVPTKPSSTVTSSDASKVFPPLPSIPQPGGDMSSALMAFKRTLAKTWHPPATPPERGTLLVSGLVEVSGTKAVCVLEVQAAYHPKESKWVSVAVGVRRIQRRKQSPRGGD